MSGVGSEPGGIDDLRDLEPPEPLERVLRRTAEMAPGTTYAARLPRYPRMLIAHLERRGLTFRIEEEPDGSALLHVWKSA